MILWQANLGRGVSSAVFERNLRRVLDAGGPRAVFCFQEIDEADAPAEAVILRRLTERTHRIFGGRTAVPILVPRDIPVTRSIQTIASRGLAKFTPHRPINEATLRVGGLEVTVLNLHLPINRPQTFTRRRDARKALRLRARAQEAGVWVADTNTHVGWPVIVPGEKFVIDAGIDKAKAWGPHKVIVTDRRRVDLTIDGHNAHGARIRWV